MSHKPEDPKKWVNLNWKKDHLLFHYKSNKRKTSLRIHNRDIMTMLQSANQCIEVRKYIEVGVTPCYLCGQPITETDSMNTVGGYKCEHIIPEYNLSMLTGLPNRLYKQEYKALMKRLQMNNPGRYEIVSRDYEKFQKQLWSLVYDYSHPICNEVKRDYSFLSINFRGEHIQVEPPVVVSDNIKKLIALLLLDKQSNKRRKKRTHKKRTHSASDVKRLSTYDKILQWRQLFMTNKSEEFKLNLAIDRYNHISNKLYDIYSFLESIDSEKLKVFSYLSIITTITITTNYVFNYGPITWTEQLSELLINSLDKVKENVDAHTSTSNFKPLEEDMKDTLIYFSEDNLTDDIIYHGLVTLKKEQPALFNLRGADTVLFTVESHPLDDIIHTNDIDKKKDFCNFFRSYMNLEYPLNGLGKDKRLINYLFKKDCINIINYIWNIWSAIFSIQEVVVNGRGNTIDDLSSGPQSDDYTSNYMDYIHYHKILERISYSLSDELNYDEHVVDEPDEPDEPVTEPVDEDEDEHEVDGPASKVKGLYMEDSHITKDDESTGDTSTDDASIFEQAYDEVEDTILQITGSDKKYKPKKEIKSESTEKGFLGNVIFMMNDLVVS